MLPFRPDRVVRLLTVLVSVAFFGTLVLGIIVLIGLPTGKLLAGDDPDWTVSLDIPVAFDRPDVTVPTGWGDALLEIEDVRGSLSVPVGIVPWWFFALIWACAAAWIALMLTFLHHLRRIAMRVRDGVPFDASNARRLRWLGLVAIGMGLLEGVNGLVGRAVREHVIVEGLRMPASLTIDGSTVLLGLVLLALAEIFRRGAELEHEQSLTV
jgi:hypothetical protein